MNLVWPNETKKETCYNCGNRPGMWPWSSTNTPTKPSNNNISRGNGSTTNKRGN